MDSAVRQAADALAAAVDALQRAREAAPNPTVLALLRAAYDRTWEALQAAEAAALLTRN